MSTIVFQWTPCDEPPTTDRPVYLTTCPRGGRGARTVHAASRYSSGRWWHHLGGPIQDVPVSWCEFDLPHPDVITEPNEERRTAEMLTSTGQAAT